MLAVLGERQRDDRDLVPVVVEGDDQRRDHQRQVGQAERVRVRRAERLDRADEVVAEQADGAAGEGKPLGVGEAEGRRCARRRPRRDRAPGCGGSARRCGRTRLPPPTPAARHRPSGGRREGLKPRNEWRPEAATLLGGLEQEATGRSSRSFRNAETGVSVSSTKVSTIGTTLPAPASSRARSSVVSVELMRRSVGQRRRSMRTSNARSIGMSRESSATSRW